MGDQDPPTRPCLIMSKFEEIEIAGKQLSSTIYRHRVELFKLITHERYSAFVAQTVIDY